MASTLTGRRVYVRSKSGLYLALGEGATGADYGPAIVQEKADANAVWIMRWPFDYLGGTKGPKTDNNRYPSSATTSTNFHLVYEPTGVGLNWYNAAHKQLSGGRYYGDYHVNGFDDNTDRDDFNCRRDVLANDANGYSYFALNNGDRTLVADLLEGTHKVGAWEWKAEDHQQWQFIAVGGSPI